MNTFNAETIKDLFLNATAANVELSEIIISAGTQQRAKPNKEALENYINAMQNGEAPNFPPIKLVRLNEAVTLPDGVELMEGALVLADGFHRVDAAIGAKLQTFQAEITDGSLQDAIYYSMTANSTNGINLVGKDYQNAIKKLYTMDGGYWREHGRKKEIAELFGCSTKTVQRATVALDKETKAQAFKLFEQGASLEDVAAQSFRGMQTIQKWFEEWQAEQDKNNNNEQGNQGSEQGEQGTNQEQHTNAGDKNPLDLTINEVINLKDSELKQKLIKLLMDSMGEPEQQEEPQPEPEQEEQPEQEEINENPTDEIAKEWKGKTWFEILGLDLAKLAGLANPKAAIKRAYNKQLKRVHSDKYGDNEALEMLKDALAQANRQFK